jgi:uncharacterized protein (TIGR00159 family)
MLAMLKALLAEISLIQIMDGILLLCLVGLSLYWTRRTRVAIFLRGFLLLLLLYLITESLPLLHLLLDRLMIGAAVAMGILFQPELRGLLEYLGRGVLLHTLIEDYQPLAEGDSLDKEDYVEELVQAVRELSQNRTGALIVIEMNEPIDPRIFTDKGVQLNARLSRELLQTIFQTSTLLHDGAVVLQQNRIRSAGVILPVSDRVASRQLGTRHRAAMGISEQTKCLCVVISEETGSISLAEAGRLERPLTSSRLRELLIEKLRPPRPVKTDSALGRLQPAQVLNVLQRFSRNLPPPLQKMMSKE